jgi:selenocysteine-specific elongation factor
VSYITLGVIGHVDHGKSTLVKALTGTETDRLKEEKERGISIALGYAHLSLPSGDIGIIDAPGHEKFIRTMIAGATGSTSVLLVVDVNEGVKPQTIEHLAIAGLLGMQRGVIALTKCDTADPELLPLLKEEIRALVADLPP